MIIINNIILNKQNIKVFEYAPDKFIIKNALQDKLKCDKIQINNTNNCLNVYWIKE